MKRREILEQDQGLAEKTCSNLILEKGQRIDINGHVQEGRADTLLLKPCVEPHLQITKVGHKAHRNRRGFCDLRLRCPSRTPEITSDFGDKTKQCCIAIQGCDGKSLAICNVELRFPRQKPSLSAGSLAIWLRQRGNC